MIKGFKKYTKSFEVTKQAAKEKMGKAENTSDTNEVKELKERLRAIKWNMKNISGTGKAYCDGTGNAGMKGSEFAEAIRTFGSQDSPFYGTPLGETMSRVGAQIKETEGALVASGLHTSTNVVAPITNFYEIEVKRVIEIKRRQEEARLKYESAASEHKEHVAKHGGVKPGSTAEEKFKAAQTQYEDLTRDLESGFNSMNSSIEREFGEYLRSLTLANVTYHEQQATMWRQLSQELGGAESVVTPMQRLSVNAHRALPPPNKPVPVPNSQQLMA